MKKLLIILFIFALAIPVYTANAGQSCCASAATNDVKKLTNDVSTSVADINKEAEDLGIPQAQRKRYVVEMRNLNELYQTGALTRTEYIGAKRQVIENLK